MSHTIVKGLGYVVIALLTLSVFSILILGFSYSLPLCNKPIAGKNTSTSNTTHCISNYEKIVIKNTMISIGCATVFILVIIVIIFIINSYTNNHDEESDELLINGSVFKSDYF
jgi:predicted nucleic acid-binding Zn ribbon protein